MLHRIYEVSFDRSGAFQHVKKVMDLKVYPVMGILPVKLILSYTPSGASAVMHNQSYVADTCMRVSRATTGKFDALHFRRTARGQ